MPCDADLAELYQVATGNFNLAVKRKRTLAGLKSRDTDARDEKIS
jgi:hypothetical protein